MKRFRILFALLLTVLLSVGGSLFAVHADFGDYGGDSDFGDSGDFDWGGNDYDYDYDDNDDDYGYHGGVYSSSDGSNWNLTPMLVGAVVVLLIVLYSKFGNRLGLKKSATRKNPVAPGAAPTNPNTLRPMTDYTVLDPQFSESAFREKLSNMYVQFQNAWQAKNLETLRPYLSDALYAKCDRQLEHYRIDRQTNRIENIAVLDVQLMGFRQEAGNDVVVARLKTRIIDYVVKDADGAIVRGSKKEKFMDYEWHLMRTSGLRTETATGTKAQNCPQCGAPIDINHTAKCEYCGCILTTDTFDWVVSEIKGISQRTGN